MAKRAFLVGPNATGKSNFLDAIRFLRDLVTEGGGLAKAVVDLRGGMRGIRSLYARKDTEVIVKVTVTDSDQNGWLYELGLSHESLKKPRPMVQREIVSRIRGGIVEPRILNRPEEPDKRDPERLTQTAIQQTTANQEFRELVEFLRGISYLHLVPQLIREEQAAPLANRIGADLYGRDLLDRIRNTPARQQRSRLKRIEGVLQAVASQFRELKLETDEHGRPHLQAKFEHWRPFGALRNEVQFSDGTLRLVGLLWSLQEGRGPLLLEEPELNLHAAIVRRLAAFIARAQREGYGPQVILSTHSEHLLADPGVAPDEVLLVRPGNNGSEVLCGGDDSDVVKLMGAGVPASEAVLPRTENPDARRSHRRVESDRQRR